MWHRSGRQGQRLISGATGTLRSEEKALAQSGKINLEKMDKLWEPRELGAE